MIQLKTTVFKENKFELNYSQNTLKFSNAYKTIDNYIKVYESDEKECEYKFKIENALDDKKN